MRGAQCRCSSVVRVAGIIPAYAGSTSILTVMDLSISGSSPRMRGAQLIGYISDIITGIIPAYAGSTAQRCCMRRASWDHPRVCGEHPYRVPRVVHRQGSSPRMRGALEPLCRCLRFLGIIPAYAGSTSPSRCPSRRHRDHPRVCGEHKCSPRSWGWPVGSSPRMRGALPFSAPVTTAMRIIPAYAGSTPPFSLPSELRRDHPRVCGEHEALGASSANKEGSSPRMRGAHYLPRESAFATGIIPAYAGSTAWSSLAAARGMDHPRVCGEHRRRFGGSICQAGSSPRMRGAPWRGLRDHGAAGIIPAYAGSTTSPRCRCGKSGDHPRVCGEHSSPLNVCVLLTGSSPRMRGAPQPPNRRIRPRGIIPAYAGSTVSEVPARGARRDHPRVCGEHSVHSTYSRAWPGSSPRMRGAQKGKDPNRCRGRIIPAYAGSTQRASWDMTLCQDHPRVCGEHPSPICPCLSISDHPRVCGEHNHPRRVRL